MEQNHPGWNAIFVNVTAYKKGVHALETAIRRQKPTTDCILYLQEYFTLLKDHHIYINPSVPAFKRFNVQSAASLDSLYSSAQYKTTEKRSVDSATLVRQLASSRDDIEGWYNDSQGNLIAVVNSPGKRWNYKGIVVSSKTKLFPAGAVKYAFQTRPNGTLWAMVTFPDHQKLYTTVSTAADGFPYIGLYRDSARTSSKSPVEESSPFAFSVLDTETNYLRVSSFDGALSQSLDSLYKAIDTQLQSKPFLVLDIRNNGGGSDGSFFGLLGHVYTQPMYSDTVDIWVSPENIRRYEEALATKKAGRNIYSQQAIAYEEALIGRLKAARPFTFISLSNGPSSAITVDSVQTYPKKIALLMNRRCASSSEMFIYYAKQSRKVITLGESSSGMMGFGNVMAVQTPCYHYSFGATTTRYRNFAKYEFVGIEPDVKLDTTHDWIAEAKKVLKKP